MIFEKTNISLSEELHFFSCASIIDTGGRESLMMMDKICGNKNLGEISSDRRIERNPRP
jgi:hypothetical protein